MIIGFPCIWISVYICAVTDDSTLALARGSGAQKLAEAKIFLKSILVSQMPSKRVDER